MATTVLVLLELAAFEDELHVEYIHAASMQVHFQTIIEHGNPAK